MATMFSHCSWCGRRYPDGLGWPRGCSGCGRTSYRNPIPVAVVVLPVDDGVLMVRRGIPPGQGLLAFPGGFINYGESWTTAAARELLEETGVTIDPDELSVVRVASAPDSTLLIFARAARRTTDSLPAFVPGEEVSERIILRRPPGPGEVAFSLHDEVVRAFFAGRDTVIR